MFNFSAERKAELDRLKLWGGSFLSELPAEYEAPEVKEISDTFGDPDIPAILRP